MAEWLSLTHLFVNNCRENHRKKGENVTEFCTLRCFLTSKVRDFFFIQNSWKCDPHHVSTIWQRNKSMGRKEKKKVHSQNSLAVEWLGLFFFFFSVWKRNCRKLALSLLRVQVQSLAGELRSLYSLTSAFLRIHELRTFIESTQAHCLHCLSHGQHQRVDQSHPSSSVITDITQAFSVCQALGYQLCWIMIFLFFTTIKTHFAGKETKRGRGYLAMKNMTGPGLRLWQGNKPQSTHCQSWLVQVYLKVGSWAWHWCPLLCCTNPSGGTHHNGRVALQNTFFLFTNSMQIWAPPMIRTLLWILKI